MSFGKLALAGIFLFAVSMAHAASLQSISIVPDKAKGIVKAFDVDNADAEAVVQQLFKAFDRRVYAQEVHGKVTVNLRNVSFDTALQNVLKQLGLTYDVLESATVIRPYNEGEQMMPQLRVHEIKVDGEIHQVLDQLSKTFGARFAVRPDVKGKVRYRAKDVTLYAALKNILPQVNAAWDFDDMSYSPINIISAEAASAPLVLMIDTKGRDFESAARITAKRLGMKCRMDGKSCILMGQDGIVVAILTAKR